MLAVAALAAGCAGGDSAPDRLLDGTKAPSPPVELKGVDGPVLLTRAVVVPPSKRAMSAGSASCLARGWDQRPGGESVERVGVASESVTFREVSGRSVFGCDNSPGPREENRRWCGGVYGQLYRGRLRDPRLDIGACSTSDGDTVAFLWVEPGQGTKFVAVPQAGYVEVYEVAGGLPIRIATTAGLVRDPLGVVVEMSEHDASGNLLRRRRVEAWPAG